MTEERLTYTVPEAAQMLGICRNNAYALVKRGIIPSINLGKRFLIPRIKLMELMTNGNAAIYEGRSITPDIRWAVWERDNFTCKHCGARTMLAVDHIVPFSKGGVTSLSNLQTLCCTCNSRKKAK